MFLSLLPSMVIRGMGRRTMQFEGCDATTSEEQIWDLGRINCMGVKGKNTPVQFILSKQKLIVRKYVLSCLIFTFSYICKIEKMDSWYRFPCIFIFCFVPIQTTLDGATALVHSPVFLYFLPRLNYLRYYDTDIGHSIW